jgi:hypothetical protein
MVLIYSLFVIAAALRKSETGDQVNQLMMLVHAGAFGMYCMSIVIYYAYSLRYYIMYVEESDKVAKAYTQMYHAWIACELINFAAQVFLILILWKLSKKVEFV